MMNPSGDPNVTQIMGSELSPTLKGVLFLGEQFPEFKIGIETLKELVRLGLLDPSVAEVRANWSYWWYGTIASSYKLYSLIKTTHPDAITGGIGGIKEIQVDPEKEEKIVRILKCEKIKYERNNFMKWIPICAECINKGDAGNKGCPMRPIDDFLHDLSDEFIPFGFKELTVDTSWMKTLDHKLKECRDQLRITMQNQFMSYTDWNMKHMGIQQMRKMLHREIICYLIDWHVELDDSILDIGGVPDAKRKGRGTRKERKRRKAQGLN